MCKGFMLMGLTGSSVGNVCRSSEMLTTGNDGRGARNIRSATPGYKQGFDRNRIPTAKRYMVNDIALKWAGMELKETVK